jgi:hypothetical protein
MSTTTTSTTGTVPAVTAGTVDTTPGPGRRRALGLRRGFLVAAPVLAGLFAVVGAAADPAVGLSGPELWKLYAENPEPLQIKSLGFHWAYAFWMAPAMMIAPLVRGRGVVLANITAFIGFVGMTTLPGLLFSDWYDSAIGQAYGVEGAQQVNDIMHTMWGIPFFVLPGIFGLVLALPLAMLTLWRAGLSTWWGLVAAVLAFVAFTGSGVTWWGCAVATVFLGVVSVALARATRVPAEL